MLYMVSRSAAEPVEQSPHDLAGSATPAGSITRSRPGPWLRLLRNRKAQVGGWMVILVVLAAILAPILTPYEPNKQDLRNKLAPPAWQSGGHWDHPLGTDHLGRDMLARILYGSRTSLSVGFLATLATAMIGILLGLVSGYFGGVADTIISRLVDIQMAFPSILLALAVTVMLGSSFRNLVIVLAVTSWVMFARIVRADVFSFKHREFIEAARSIGAGHVRIMRLHVAPNLVGTVMVVLALTVARVVIAEASLSFLGVGIQPPTASWGGMLSEGRDYLSVAWWISTMPGIALMITVIGISLLGDALRDILDPRLANASH